LEKVFYSITKSTIRISIIDYNSSRRKEKEIEEKKRKEEVGEVEI